jgi:dipeptidyl aminopeptidase/acylaminoacyl peptidase
MPTSRRRIKPEDIYRLRTVSDPQISPDGKWTACVISQANRKKDRWLSDIWLFCADGRQRVQLTNRHHRDSSPRWSPDGRTIAFLSPDTDDDNAKAQLWLIPVAGGEAKQLTHLRQGAGSPA